MFTISGPDSYVQQEKEQLVAILFHRVTGYLPIARGSTSLYDTDNLEHGQRMPLHIYLSYSFGLLSNDQVLTSSLLSVSLHI